MIGVNSFGIGGSYAHVIVEEYREASSGFADDGVGYNGWYVLPLSALSEQHFQLFARQLNESMADQKVSLLDACGTMAACRSRMKCRKAILAQSKRELLEKLDQLAQAKVGPSMASTSIGHRPLFVFTGQGAQWMGCGETLMAWPAYREAVLLVDRLFTKLSGWSVLEKSKILSSEQLVDTIYAQPVTFMIQIGLFNLLKQLGIRPTMVSTVKAGPLDSRTPGPLPCFLNALGAHSRSLACSLHAGGRTFRW